MKIKRVLKWDVGIATTTMFFCGIVITAGALYEVQSGRGQITLPQTCIGVAITYFIGLLAVHFASRFSQSTVVYVTKKEGEKTAATTVDTESQLNIDALQQLMLRQDGDVSQTVINELSRQLNAGQAALYVVHGQTLVLKCGFALADERTKNYTCDLGEGLVGRVAREGQRLYIDQLPKGYITVFSGLGAASPTYLAIVPLKIADEVKGVLEIATFEPLKANTFLQLETIGTAWAAAGL